MNYHVHIDSSGTKRYYLNNLLHCEYEPAIEFSNGGKVWCQYGKLHREDGPAIEHFNGAKE